MVIRELLNDIEKRLTESGIENAKFESVLIVRSVFGFDALSLMMNAKNEADSAKVETALSYAERRAANEPLQYILGTQEFMSLEFEVNPSVLIPRADTETLVEHALSVCEKTDGLLRILDIGAGSGCIGISIAHYAPNTRVTELDISEDALMTAQRNSVLNGTQSCMSFERRDILSELPNMDGGLYDIVVSNPPYIETAVIDTLDENVRAFEPHTALDGGADGLVFYRRIVNIAPLILRRGGTIIFEIGYEQGESVSALMCGAGFGSVRVIKDLCGCDRVVAGTLE